MLRRSWLTLLTAEPKGGEMALLGEEDESSSCMARNSRSAMPISSWRSRGRDDALRILGRRAEGQHIGGERRIGLTSTWLRARKTRPATSSDRISDMRKMLSA